MLSGSYFLEEFMKISSLVLALAIVGAAFPLSCGVRAADTRPATASPPGAELLAIRYQRSGGFAGTNDVMEITPKGEVVVQGKLMGNGKGQLKPEQIAKLVKLFADWKN